MTGEMKKLIWLLLLAGLTISAQAQERTVYQHPLKGFAFRAEAGWQAVDHPEDSLIYELADPAGEIRVMLWFTETESDAPAYLNKMAGMKGYRREQPPRETQIGARAAWLLEAEGALAGKPGKVWLASIPLMDEAHTSFEDHIAHYIVQIWCPVELADEKAAQVEAILGSVKVF
jgi:hypothetical protein